MSTSLAWIMNGLKSALRRIPSRSSGVVMRIGSIDLILNGSMIVFTRGFPSLVGRDMQRTNISVIAPNLQPPAHAPNSSERLVQSRRAQRRAIRRVIPSHASPPYRLSMDSGPIELHLRCRVSPGSRAAFLGFLSGAIPFYESPGGITVRLLQDLHDDHRFIEVVRYADEGTFALDQQRVEDDPTMKTYLARWRELLAEPVTVEVYRHVAPSPQ